MLGYSDGDADIPSNLDSAADVPHSLVVDGAYSWHRHGPLRRPYADTIIYETHVKGFTMKHPEVPEELRGTYAGLGHEAAVRYLTDLGVTAVELLPVHEFVPEGMLTDRGLTNYWGYNTIGFFAPSHGTPPPCGPGSPAARSPSSRPWSTRCTGPAWRSFSTWFSTTAPRATSWARRCASAAWTTRSTTASTTTIARFYFDTTGTGNSLNAGHPRTLQLMMDSLRYWLTEMHVDGFRFDLAATLARQEGGFDNTSAFFDLVSQDPVVSQAKLIAEPWDVGQLDSYDLGRFPPLWSEWNGKYRDSMRDFWRSQPVGLGEFASRFAGSSDLYGWSRRRPTASVNLITVHDGFTLRDLVSYDGKHNEANGEDNHDGTDDNRSWNCGAEGPDQRSRRAGPARPADPGHARHPAAVFRHPHAARR